MALRTVCGGFESGQVRADLGPRGGRGASMARAYAEQQTTRKQVGGRWCGSGTGAAALRMVAEVCRQCTHRSSKVKEGFFLCKQRCSVGHALASHVRGQRKFNP
jgi:hypothetical protein